MDWFSWWLVILGAGVALYLAGRLVLRHYFPPDT
jgi:hypothetical protein